MRGTFVGCAALLLMASLAQADFDDPFDTPALDERWEWHVPRPGPDLSLTANPGHLRITLPAVPGGYNQWVNPEAKQAPLLLTAAPRGDFLLSARVKLISHTPQSNFHLALITGPSKRYLLGWGPFFAPALGNPTQAPEVWGEPTGQGGYLKLKADCSDLILAIRKRGRVYEMLVRGAENAPWRTVGNWETPWPPKYVGFMGKTFGDAGPVIVDIDWIRLETSPSAPEEPLVASIKVDATHEGWPLDEMRFGQFIEHMFDCIQNGIWAELVWNRKFTGPVDGNGVVEGWRASGLREGVRYSRDNHIYYSPAQSQRIELPDGEPAGISQEFGLRGGVGYRARLVARQDGLAGPVSLLLIAGDRLISRADVAVGQDWTVREVDLAGPERECTGRFVIQAAGPGTLWLGAVSVMPADNVEGFRADVLEAIREIRPPLVRWPGGNFVSGYDWRDGIGERDRRPPRWNRAWNHWEFNDVGTDEFIRFARLVGTEPYICVNAGEGNARDAAAWVEYCNASADSAWGKVRAAGGNPEPYGVEIWGIGNEIYGPWQLGHLPATRYGIKAVEFAEAMKAVDPGIRLIGVGVDADGWGNWNAEVSRIAGHAFDWLSVHYYLGIESRDDPVVNYMSVLGGPPAVERMLERSWQIACEASGKDLPIAFDEWNVVVDNGGTFYSLRDGLFACAVFNALHRLGPKCPMANLAQLVNVLGAIETTQTRVLRTPVHRAFQLYLETSQPVGVPVEHAGPSIETPGGRVDALDVVASRSEDRSALTIALINRMPGDPVTADIQLGDFVARGPVRVSALMADTPEATNTFEEPDRVTIKRWSISVDELRSLEVPPHTAMVLEMGRE